MHQAGDELQRSPLEQTRVNRIAPRKRVMLQLLIFVIGFVLVLFFQGFFSYSISQLEQKINNQQSLIHLSEILYQDLLNVEKQLYLIALTTPGVKQLAVRSHLYKNVSQIKAKLAIMRWGGSYTLPTNHEKTKSLTLQFSPSAQDSTGVWPQLKRLTTSVKQLEEQIGLFQLSLIEAVRQFDDSTDLIVALKPKSVSLLQKTRLLVKELQNESTVFLNHHRQFLEVVLAKLDRQKRINMVLNPLLSIIILIIVIAMGFWIARQVDEEDAKVQKLITELENARDTEREIGKAKANFLSTISHEILTPINAVVGVVSILLNSKLNKEQNRYARSIKESSDHLLNVVNDIQDFYKLDSGQFSFDHIEFDLQTLIESIYEIIFARALKKRLKVSYLVDSQVKSMFIGDPAKIRQVLINLLSNALKFTPSGGIVLEVKLTPAKNWVRFEVHDTGIGISEQAKAELFHSFSQVDSGLSRQYGGTGLGLAISKHIVELMGGEIGVESQSNRGSSFWFELPLEKISPLRNEEIHLMDETFQQQEVVYIDDLPLNQNLNLHKLQRWNLKPKAKTNTADGFKALWKNKVTGKEDYVIFIDLAMDNDEQAFDFVHQVKAESSFKAIPIVFSTALALKRIELSLPNCREERIIPIIKPYRNDQLFTAFSNAIRQLDQEEEQYPLVDQYLEEIKKESTEEPQNALNVLVVDDNSTNQMVAKGYLAQKGCKVSFADNGKEAFERVKREDFDLILMDLQMPIMDGISATKAIRQLAQTDKNSVPIVAMTANALAEERQNCYDAGMNDFLSKPIDKTMLEVVLASYLDSKVG